MKIISKLFLWIAMTLLVGRSATMYVDSVSNYCCLPADPGTCNSPESRYYYNCFGKYCDTFIYYGCEGNANNFVTLKECERYCLGA